MTWLTAVFADFLWIWLCTLVLVVLFVLWRRLGRPSKLPPNEAAEFLERESNPETADSELDQLVHFAMGRYVHPAVDQARREVADLLLRERSETGPPHLTAEGRDQLRVV